MCSRHWRSLSTAHRRAVLSAYRRGQEVTKAASLTYRIAALRAALWLGERERVAPDLLEGHRTTIAWLETKLMAAPAPGAQLVLL